VPPRGSTAHRGDPTRLVEETLEYVDSGFDAVKVRLGTEWE
jgi:hypothetical protein